MDEFVVEANEAVEGVCLIERGAFELVEGVRDTIQMNCMLALSD